jgi:hypothetical protein
MGPAFIGRRPRVADAGRIVPPKASDSEEGGFPEVSQKGGHACANLPLFASMGHRAEDESLIHEEARSGRALRFVLL